MTHRPRSHGTVGRCARFVAVSMAALAAVTACSAGGDGTATATSATPRTSAPTTVAVATTARPTTTTAAATTTIAATTTTTAGGVAVAGFGVLPPTPETGGRRLRRVADGYALIGSPAVGGHDGVVWWTPDLTSWNGAERHDVEGRGGTDELVDLQSLADTSWAGVVAVRSPSGADEPAYDLVTSTDRGATWARRRVDGTTMQRTPAFLPTPDGPVVAAAADDRVTVWRLEGGTWTAQVLPEVAGVLPSEVFLVGVPGLAVLTVTGLDVNGFALLRWVSVDGGRTWAGGDTGERTPPRGFTLGDGERFWRFEPSETGMVSAISADHVTWRTVASPLTVEPGTVALPVRALRAGACTVVVAQRVSGGQRPFESPGAVARTCDDGATWTEVASPVPLVGVTDAIAADGAVLVVTNPLPARQALVVRVPVTP